ncbi:kinase-like protein [Thelephora ganbajun]|uniref:Kinase-like protein n=1 Tax=Thelephora ganbajun TaxID=370292 RepID=A0ACB6ZB82_THEGA|nr:kinase-like protein [Thelephora ganbajun]
MDGSGHARITDFGLAQDTTGVVSISGAHSSRWTAPEVLNGGTPSTKADVFSFAMVMVEVFTGTVPFNQYTSLVAVVAIIQEERPPWPTHPTFTEELRELMKRCWNQDQCKRPQTSEVLQTLNSLMPRSAEPGCSDQPLLHERTHPGEPLPVTADVQIPVPDIQQQLEKSDPSNEEYRPLLDVLLSRQDLDPHIQNLQGSDLQSFVELLDKALIHIPPTDDLFRKTLCRLQSTCSNREVLPLSCVIPNGGLSNRGEAIASGSFTDVYQAELDGKKVCVKTCKLCDQDAMSITKKTLYGEVVVWKRLQHPNIVPFLGVSTRIEPTLEIVYDWMENGRIAEYVERNPGVDRINLVCDVADGLCYLHSSNVIHGNLEDVSHLALHSELFSESDSDPNELEGEHSDRQGRPRPPHERWADVYHSGRQFNA